MRLAQARTPGLNRVRGAGGRSDGAMEPRNFNRLLQRGWDRQKFVCVGLDSDADSLPVAHLASAGVGDRIFAFNRAIVDATADLVCAYKPNSAFYEAQGPAGIEALIRTIAHIHETAPEVPVILDAKRGDIDNTNRAYARFVFDICGADAVTVHPYLGREALSPFLEREDRGIIVLCHNSNPGAREFQDLPTQRDRPLYQVVAEHVATVWNAHGNCAVMVGGTYPDAVETVRRIIGDMAMLIAGIGAQGGDLGDAVRAGLNSRRDGVIVNSSRQVIFRSAGKDFAEAARREVVALDSRIRRIRDGL
ncbi:MAG TPA: orotidine-5'-phosphate decarboxylase [bacterium]|nr:orotidine-5'-phosphate decarboxylase [bacterium]